MDESTATLALVAPRAGAWIEARSLQTAPERAPSLPARERGLKLAKPADMTPESRSLPARERGLKRLRLLFSPWPHSVAPRAGAWIEACPTPLREVAPLSLPARERGLKPPYPGWAPPEQQSLPARERGLKLATLEHRLERALSLPVRERGLKPWRYGSWPTCCCVAPRAGAWIEACRVGRVCRCTRSLLGTIRVSKRKRALRMVSVRPLDFLVAGAGFEPAIFGL